MSFYHLRFEFGRHPFRITASDILTADRPWNTKYHQQASSLTHLIIFISVLLYSSHLCFRSFIQTSIPGLFQSPKLRIGFKGSYQVGTPSFYPKKNRSSETSYICYILELWHRVVVGWFSDVSPSPVLFQSSSS